MVFVLANTRTAVAVNHNHQNTQQKIYLPKIESPHYLFSEGFVRTLSLADSSG